jgi:hypothetical protein
MKGIVQSDLQFKFVSDRGRSGVQINETLNFIYLDSVLNLAASSLLTALTNQVKQNESCQISVVGINVNPVPNEPMTFRSSVDFKIRKCVGTDYPCGETCEIRWSYQACRTDYCRATAISNIGGGSANGTTTVNISKSSDTEIKAEATTPDYRSEVSIGDIGEALIRLGLSRADFDNIFGIQRPDLSTLISNSKFETQIPQPAFIYKPKILEAGWKDMTSLGIPEAQRFGVMISRQAQIEKTVACKWIACARNGTPDKCSF